MAHTCVSCTIHFNTCLQVPDPDARIKGASLFDTWSKELGRLGDDGSDHAGTSVHYIHVFPTILATFSH